MSGGRPVTEEALQQMADRAAEAAAGLEPGFPPEAANLMLDIIGAFRGARDELTDKRAIVEAIELELPPDYRPKLDLPLRVKGLLFDWRKATGQIKPPPEPDLSGVPVEMVPVTPVMHVGKTDAPTGGLSRFRS